VTAEDEGAAWTLVEQDLDEGSIQWPKSEIKKISQRHASGLVGKRPSLDLRAFRGETAGIWYKSGRALFEEWDEE